MVFAKTQDHAESSVTLTAPKVSVGFHSMSRAHSTMSFTDQSRECWNSSLVILASSMLDLPVTMEKEWLAHVPPLLSYISQSKVWNLSEVQQMEEELCYPLEETSLSGCWPFDRFDLHNPYVCCSILWSVVSVCFYHHHKHFFLLVASIFVMVSSSVFFFFPHTMVETTLSI